MNGLEGGIREHSRRLEAIYVSLRVTLTVLF